MGFILHNDNSNYFGNHATIQTPPKPAIERNATAEIST